MAKVLQGQLTVVGPTARDRRAAPDAASPRHRERAASPAAAPDAVTRHLDLDEVLLALQRRAPAPSVGPSHWWG